MKNIYIYLEDNAHSEVDVTLHLVTFSDNHFGSFGLSKKKTKLLTVILNQPYT
jgi:predicted MPP superfamily phosphohydrolase